MAISSIDGLVSGLNTTDIINSLMDLERIPVIRMEEKRKTYDARASAWNDIVSRITGLKTAIGNILTADKMRLFKGSSSEPDLMKITAGATAQPGSIAFKVQQLAKSHMLGSQGFSTSTQIVGAGTATLASIKDLGFSGAIASAGLASGAHRFEVVSLEGPPTPAEYVGDPIAASFPVTFSGTLTMKVNGVTSSLNFASKTYNTIEELRTELQTKLDTAYGAGVVSVDVKDTSLRLRTTATGTTSNIQVTGGSAQTYLGLRDATMRSGADNPGIIVALDGKETVLGKTATLTAGTVKTITAPDGSTLTLTVGSTPIRLGSGTVDVVRTTSATTNLEDLAKAITDSGNAGTAQVINTGIDANPWKMVVSAKSTGSDASMTVDMSGFASGAFTSPFTEIQAGTDALLKLGNLDIYRQSNTITDLIKGATIELTKADPTKEVTLKVDRDHDAVIEKAKAFVDALNAVHKRIQELTKYDVDKKQASILTGDSRARAVTSQLFSAIGDVTTDDGVGRTLLQVGIRYQANGQYTFDSGKLKTALENDFESVVELFARTGEGLDGRAQFLAATDDTTAGTGPRNVSITQAAQRAELAGSFVSVLTAASTINVTVGGSSISYYAAIGSNSLAITNGLNREFREKGMGIEAAAEGGSVVLRTKAYGSGATFTVSSTGTEVGLNATRSGTDVVGTVNGVAGTGQGQTLTVPSGDAKGLALRITASQADVTGAGGTLSLGGFTYRPGAAGALSRTLKFLTDDGGPVNAAIEGAETVSKDISEKIAQYEKRLEDRRMRYVRQFSALEMTLSQLQNQGGWLSATMGTLANSQGAK